MSAHESRPTHAVVIEDQPEYLELIRRYLDQTPGLVCVGAYPTGDLALKEIPKLPIQPDIAIVDIHLPGICGLDCISWLRMQNPAMKRLVLSGEDQPEYVLAATRAGADGYLTKPCDRPQLAQAIADTMAGLHPVSPTVAGHLMSAVTAGAAAVFRPHPKLSDRENEVMRWLVEGRLNKEIADRLGVSTSTVNAHLHSIYTKLGVQNRVEAVKAVIRA